MNIVLVSSEVVPFAKTGGLGDVLGALPAEFAKAGHTVKVFMPRYATISDSEDGQLIKKTSIEDSIIINGSKFSLTASTLKSSKLPLEYIFVENEMLFNRPELYRDPETGEDYIDNDDRFIFFNKAVMKLLQLTDFSPDIMHVHDWQAGLIPAYLKLLFVDHPLFRHTKSVLTIHNLAFQGTFENKSYAKLGLEEELFYPTSPFEFYGKINFLKAAMFYADKITTVSENYAEEILSEQFGCGLQGVLRDRKADLHGILNGVDYSIWSPSRDKKINHKYVISNLSGKKMNKIDLLNKAKLPIRDKTPLIGIISRLADQKGFDLIEEIIDEIFSMDVQLILLGTGEEKYHKLFTAVEKKYPDKCKVYLTFDDVIAHQIEAAADIFLMPSQYEPCGLNQMYSLKYGTVPIVRKVGGLADTVEDFDEKTGNGTGFVFEKYDSKALLEAISRAVTLFQSKRKWTKVMKRGMKLDYSWKSSAGKYLELFKQLAG